MAMPKADPPGCAAYFTELFRGQAVAAIVRGSAPSETVAICERLWDAGIHIAEIPIQTEQAEASLAAAVEAGRRRGRIVGAGTVTTARRVWTAADLGARFTVAPGLDERVARACEEAGLAHLPGVATPSEVQHAVALGFSWLKLFPANELGPLWVKSLLAPFPRLQLVAAGGMSSANAPAFLAAGARVVAVGGALRDPGEVATLAKLAPRYPGRGAGRGGTDALPPAGEDWSVGVRDRFRRLGHRGVDVDRRAGG